MIKLVLSAVWVCIITLASSYVAASWKARGTIAATGEEGLTGLNYTKTELINVPMIADGAVKGYVVAQFVYTADAGDLKQLSVPPDAFILDEAFRTIYEDDRIDLDHLERFDIASLTTKLKEDANKRFGMDLLQDVLVQQFTFVTKEEVRAQAGASAAGPVVAADTALEPKPGEKAEEGEAAAPEAKDHASKAPEAHE
jgi:hypothetical protein